MEVKNMDGVSVVKEFLDVVFQAYLDKFVAVFIEDILIHSKNQEEHEQHLRIMLRTLRKDQLYAKFSKCEFWLKSVSFLGHVMVVFFGRKRNFHLMLVFRCNEKLSGFERWDGLKRDVVEYVAKFLVCQQVKAELKKPIGKLQPLPVLE
ncbi:Uncharacterized protein TCM_035762 [Theobroma cacao]|uniref:Reverse transcriptase domain-containing protein n=1 Tax=Theobroma cacao TaxID=3641 RepID=A0A061FJJ8_THECC|nr:Uncharacterized protein TCM_035762 [Theobroma cacao]